MKQRTIRLLARNLFRLSIREWGMPALCCVGKMWRSERRRTVTCLLAIPGDPTKLSMQVRRVEIVDHVEDQWLPATWRRAIPVYREEWPASAPKLRPAGYFKVPK